MRLVYHGGRCCGIKQIHMLYSGPDFDMPKLAEYVGMGAVGESARMFKGARPAETARERLEFLLGYCRTQWPDHIIEAVTAETPYSKQTTSWGPTLEELGFKKVNENLNSNSKNVCTVWHYNINGGKGPVETAKSEAVPEPAPMPIPT